MVDQNLINYIRDNLRKGYSPDSLRKTLIDEGWDAREVDEAIMLVQTPRPPPPSRQPLPPPPTPWPQQAGLPPQPAPAQQPVRGRAQPPKEQKPQATPSRPLGVTIISILGIIGAIFVLIMGFFIAGLGFLIGGDVIPLPLGNFTMLGNETAPFGSEILGAFISYLGFAFIIMGILELVGFILLLKMKRIGWIIIMILGILQIIGYLFPSLISFTFDVTSIPILLLWIIVVGYLFMKRKLFA